MRDNNILPDLITYSTINKSFCRDGDLKNAKWIFENNIFIYYIIISKKV